MSKWLCLNCGMIYSKEPNTEYFNEDKNSRMCINSECCDGEVVEVDENFVGIIRELNRIGMPTEYCCSGHAYDNSSGAYITFNSYVSEMFENNMWHELFHEYICNKDTEDDYSVGEKYWDFFDNKMNEYLNKYGLIKKFDDGITEIDGINEPVIISDCIREEEDTKKEDWYYSVNGNIKKYNEVKKDIENGAKYFNLTYEIYSEYKDRKVGQLKAELDRIFNENDVNNRCNINEEIYENIIKSKNTILKVFEEKLENRYWDYKNRSNFLFRWAEDLMLMEIFSNLPWYCVIENNINWFWIKETGELDNRWCIRSWTDELEKVIVFEKWVQKVLWSSKIGNEGETVERFNDYIRELTYTNQNVIKMSKEKSISQSCSDVSEWCYGIMDGIRMFVVENCKDMKYEDKCNDEIESKCME